MNQGDKCNTQGNPNRAGEPSVSSVLKEVDEIAGLTSDVLATIRDVRSRLWGADSRPGSIDQDTVASIDKGNHGELAGGHQRLQFIRDAIPHAEEQQVLLRL